MVTTSPVREPAVDPHHRHCGHSRRAEHPVQRVGEGFRRERCRGGLRQPAGRRISTLDESVELVLETFRDGLSTPLPVLRPTFAELSVGPPGEEAQSDRREEERPGRIGPPRPLSNPRERCEDGGRYQEPWTGPARPGHQEEPSPPRDIGGNRRGPAGARCRIGFVRPGRGSSPPLWVFHYDKLGSPPKGQPCPVPRGAHGSAWTGSGP